MRWHYGYLRDNGMPIWTLVGDGFATAEEAAKAGAEEHPSRAIVVSNGKDEFELHYDGKTKEPSLMPR